MKLKPIKTKKEYEDYLDWVDALFNKKIKPASPEGEELQVALLLIKQFEERHFLIPVPNPIEAIKLKMEEKGIKNKDLIGVIGSKGYISSLLSGKKPLTLEIARIFHHKLGVPAEILLS
jgi:HTH-type transcriptional regulator/antitoxin HigA